MKKSFEELFPDLTQLMGQIINCPKDLQLRLHYADLWDAIGFLDHDRSALIRFQINHQYQESNEILLRKSFDARFDVRYPTYVNGFIEKIMLSPEDTTSTLQPLFAVSPIRHVDMSRPDPIHALDEFGGRLVSMTLFGGNDSTVEEIIRKVPNLKWLTISNGSVTAAGIHMLAASSLPLQYVNLNGNPAHEYFDVVYEDQGVVCHVSEPSKQKRLPIVPDWLKEKSRKVVRFNL